MDKLSVPKKIILFVCLSCFLVSLIVLPSSAADVFDSLYLTTWMVSSDATVLSGYGDFNVSGYISFGAGVYSFSRLLIGYDSNSASADSIAFFDGTSYDHWYLEDGDIVISFTGGSDLTDQALIQWVRTYAHEEPFYDFSGNDYVISGVRLLSSTPDLEFLFASTLVSNLSFITGGTGFDDYSVSFSANGKRFFGLYSDSVAFGSFTTLSVYNSSSGWVDQEYRLLDFGSGSSVGSLRLYNWILNNSEDVTDTADYERGLLAGYGEGYSSGYDVGYDQGYSEAYDDGYSVGYEDGAASNSSENFGKNLLGDTLSAPMDALNQFTLYESSSGFKVTLGLVVGGAISLTLFIAFLKIFAGG